MVARWMRFIEIISHAGVNLLVRRNSVRTLIQIDDEPGKELDKLENEFCIIFQLVCLFDYDFFARE